MRLGDLDALKEAVDTWDKFGYTAQGELIRLTEKTKNYMCLMLNIRIL